MQAIRVQNRLIGPGYPCFIIAEISANHNQSFDTAAAIIQAVAEAGADAVKLQTYTPDTITIDCDKEWFRIGGTENPDEWRSKTLYKLYQTAYTPWEWQPKLKKIADDLGMLLFSSPFDETAVDFLEQMNVPCYKVASYETTHIPLLKKIAATGKPVIMSTGFATEEEIALAVRTLRDLGSTEIALLHCVTSYAEMPQDIDLHLRNIPDLAARFGVVSGFSDNNGGIEAAVAAVLAGASIVEKHVILSHDEGGPDAKFSITPEELKEMVRRIREAEKTLGTVHYGPLNSAEEYNTRFRRSIFVVQDIKAGEQFTANNVRVIRPAQGLAPKFYEEIIGQVATEDIERGTPLSWDQISFNSSK